MFKSFLSSIVGDDTPPAPTPQPPSTSPRPPPKPPSSFTDPSSRPPSQPPSGRSSPMSESGASSFGGSAFGGRRGSSSSMHSLMSPVGAPDLSHLSAEERAQIEAVIARARQMQDVGDQQIRDIEKDFGAATTTPEPAKQEKPKPSAGAISRERGPLSGGEAASKPISGVPSKPAPVSSAKSLEPKPQPPTIATGAGGQRTDKSQSVGMGPQSGVRAPKSSVMTKGDGATQNNKPGQPQPQRLPPGSGNMEEVKGQRQGQSQVKDDAQGVDPRRPDANQRNTKQVTQSDNQPGFRQNMVMDRRTAGAKETQGPRQSPTVTQENKTDPLKSQHQSLQTSSIPTAPTMTTPRFVSPSPVSPNQGPRNSNQGPLPRAPSGQIASAPTSTAQPLSAFHPHQQRGPTPSKTMPQPQPLQPSVPISKPSPSVVPSQPEVTKTSTAPPQSRQMPPSYAPQVTNNYAMLPDQRRQTERTSPSTMSSNQDTTRDASSRQTTAMTTGSRSAAPPAEAPTTCAHCGLNIGLHGGEGLQPCVACKASVCKFCAANVNKGSQKPEWWCLKCMKQKHAPPSYPPAVPQPKAQQPTQQPPRTQPAPVGYPPTHGYKGDPSSQRGYPQTQGDGRDQREYPPMQGGQQKDRGRPEPAVAQLTPSDSKRKEESSSPQQRHLDKPEMASTQTTKGAVSPKTSSNEPMSSIQSDSRTRDTNANRDSTMRDRDRGQDRVADNKQLHSTQSMGQPQDKGKDTGGGGFHQNFPVPSGKPPKGRSRSKENVFRQSSSESETDKAKSPQPTYISRDSQQTRLDSYETLQRDPRGQDKDGYQQGHAFQQMPQKQQVHEREREKEWSESRAPYKQSEDYLQLSAKGHGDILGISPSEQRPQIGDSPPTPEDSKVGSSAFYKRGSGVGGEDQDPDLQYPLSPPENWKSPVADLQSPTEHRRSPRPSVLAISPKSPPTSLDLPCNRQTTCAEDTKGGAPQKKPPRQSTAHAPESNAHAHNKADVVSKEGPHQVRTVGEGAETPTKKKPSPLDRVSLTKVSPFDNSDPRSVSPNRRQSPSRVSPRSPPRSPSWMRYRESPPRSPGMKLMSPTKSPTERFPSNFSELPHGERQGTYGGEEEFTFPDDYVDLQQELDMSGEKFENDKPPPKPARLNAGLNSNSNSASDSNGMDVASYAATIASSTAHLTSMSVSPTNQNTQPNNGGNTQTSSTHSPDPDQSDDVPPPDKSDLMSPQSPYFDDEELDPVDPSAKSIDYQNTVRQKAKPPATDWSPVTDLSPIIDVSPSLEKIEQEKMLAEQEGYSDAGNARMERGGGADMQSQNARRSPYEHAPSVSGPPPHPQQQQQQFGGAFPPSSNEPTSSKPPLTSSCSPTGLSRAAAAPAFKPEPSSASQPDNRLTHNEQKQAAHRVSSAGTETALTLAAAASHTSDSQAGEKSVGDNSRDYHLSHHSFEGDPEIDLDDDIPPQKRTQINIDASTLINDDPIMLQDDQDIPFERQGGLVRSKVRFFSRSESSDTYDSKPPSHSLSDDNVGSVTSRFESFIASSNKLSSAGTEERTNLSVSKTQDYPSSSPEKEHSPARSVSPATRSTARGGGGGGGNRFARSRSLDNPPKPERDSERKAKRKLPAVPSSVEEQRRTVSPKPATQTMKRSPSDSPRASPRASPATTTTTAAMQLKQDKELLRRRLKQKAEAERAAAVNGLSGASNGAVPSASMPMTLNRGHIGVGGAMADAPKGHQQTIKPVASQQRQQEPTQIMAPKPSPHKTPPQTLPKPLHRQAPPPVAPKPAPKPSPAKKVPVAPQAPKKVETVSVYGIDVPVDVRSMKKRIREEIQIVTATRRLKIDEMEEVRIMERELAEREKKRKLTLEIQARTKAKQRMQEEKERERLRKLEEEIKKQREQEKLIDKDRLEAEERILARKHSPISATSEMDASKLSANVTDPVGMSPQKKTRTHRRQNSDPILNAFSPIEEKEFETEASFRLGMEARRLGSSLSMYSPQPQRRGMRSGGVTPSDFGSGYSDRNDRFTPGYPLQSAGRSKSSEILYLVDKDERLQQNFDHPLMNQPLSRGMKSKSQYSGIDQMKDKEEKRYMLQIEIDKRKQALEENARLRREIQKLTEAANIGEYEFTVAKSKYKEHKSSQQKAPAPRQDAGRIIKPLDSHERIPPTHIPQMYHSDRYLDTIDSSKKQPPSVPVSMPVSIQTNMPPHPMRGYHGTAAQPPPPHCNYSSTEYLSHHRVVDPRTIPPQAMYDRGGPPELYYQTLPHVHQQHQHLPQGMPPDYRSAAQFYLGDRHGDEMMHAAARGMLGGSYPGDGKAPYHRADLDYYAMNGMAGLDAQSETSIATDTTVTSVKDVTPSMPILDDVTMRSRSKLRKIGSRPLSDDFGEYNPADPMSNLLLRTESEHSVAESDDHIMEGGITIQQRKDIARRQDDTIKPRGPYHFETKCILLTKDPKERSVQGRKQGNGIGMKIVGGKIIPGTNEVGAYVSAIYPGGVADQLHGELQEGDQVLEWNGISLTGKTYEEVQHIISQPNGEIELVVRPFSRLPQKDQTMSTLSAHSSYDNLESTTSDYEDFDGRLLAPRAAAPVQSNPRSPNNNTTTATPLATSTATNAKITVTTTDTNKQQNPQSSPLRHHFATNQAPHLPPPGLTEHHMSPGASPSSSQHDMYLSPSASMSGSSHSDHIIELPMLGADPETNDRDPHDWGELQLQLSYDDYDGTLNIHVMQAKGLKPKDRNGLSDPFVKCYLLPGRIGENKRRTKIIQRCLDPEWHQTLVYMKISRDELKVKTLEVTLWDYDRFKPNDFLGEVFLDLGDPCILDNKPHWYKLHEHNEHMASRLSKVVPYAAGNSRNPPSRGLEHHSFPIDETSGSEQSFAMKPVLPPQQQQQQSQVQTHKDVRSLQPGQSSGAKYSPGLGRRKDTLKHDRINKRTSDGFVAFS